MNTTRTPRPDSFDQQVRKLEPGEFITKARAVNNGLTLGELPRELVEIRQQLRNAVAPAVARAKAATEGIYTTEIGEVTMPTGNLFVVAVITRAE
jgi:hypothetical protein